MYQPPKRTAGKGSARKQRLFQILVALYEERYTTDNLVNDNGYEGSLTTTQIARTCGMSLSPHFRGLLDELFGKGLVKVTVDNYRPTMQRYYWFIDEYARYHQDFIGCFDAYLDPEGALK